MPTLTVRETLEFAAKLKIKDEKIVQQKIDILVKKLKL